MYNIGRWYLRSSSRLTGWHSRSTGYAGNEIPRNDCLPDILTDWHRSNPSAKHFIHINRGSCSCMHYLVVSSIRFDIVTQNIEHSFNRCNLVHQHYRKLRDPETPNPCFLFSQWLGGSDTADHRRSNGDYVTWTPELDLQSSSANERSYSCCPIIGVSVLEDLKEKDRVRMDLCMYDFVADYGV